MVKKSSRIDRDIPINSGTFFKTTRYELSLSRARTHTHTHTPILSLRALVTLLWVKVRGISAASSSIFARGGEQGGRQV